MSVVCTKGDIACGVIHGDRADAVQAVPASAQQATVTPLRAVPEDCDVQATWDTIAALLVCARNGDRAASAALCERFTPLVQACARRYRNARLQWEDLVQCGYEQLLLAIQSYDEARGVHFAHYAKRKVYGGIYSFVRTCERTERRECVVDERRTGEDWLLHVPDRQTGADFEAVEWSDFFTTLSPRERLAMVATVIGHETTGELAARTGVGRESAKTWRKRAIAKLRHTWKASSD